MQRIGRYRRRRPIRELVAGHPGLETIVQRLLAVRVALRREFDPFAKQCTLRPAAIRGREQLGIPSHEISLP
jgi:hypothetical protein